MLRQQHPRSAARHIPTPYDGHGLGRDDPVWPCYVKEAEKWDSDLVDGWNKGMDVLLLFVSSAALFSAVVTGFLIDSYKNLQQDSAEATAAEMAQITYLLQAIALGERPDPRNSTEISSFQPTTTAVAINLAWFLSLSLSIWVALVAMLVKQWGESYQSGRGLTPPCVQARIRQSRFDKLIKWRTEDIVLVLPVVMHIALGLFLIGLLFFLWDLNHTVALPVMVVVGVTFTCYALTTILPFFVAFCPYNTPVSSRKLWAYLCRMIWSSTHSEDNKPFTRCEWEEKETSEWSAPDKVTGRALDWLIKHSEEESVVDVAIRAIAGANLPKNVWALLAKDSLIILVAQKFTALFGGVLDQDVATPESDVDMKSSQFIEDAEGAEKRLEIISLYGRALTNIAKHWHRPIDASAGDEAQQQSRPLVPLTPDQTQAVTRGLLYLVSSKSPNIAAFGITSISAWYMFTVQTRSQWKDTLGQSFRIMLAHVKGEAPVRPDALAGLMHSLPIEISYWKQDLSKSERRQLLLPLVELLHQDRWADQIQKGLPLMLAVLAISVNDYPDLYTDDEYRQWRCVYEPYSDLARTHFEAAEKHNHGPSHYQPGLLVQHDAANRAGWRAWRAQQAARIYTIYPQLLKDHAEKLSLVGLTGLLGSLGALGLEDKSTDITITIARQLGKISILNKSQSIDLPLVLPFTFDIRAYAIDRIIQTLRPSRYRDQTTTLQDQAKRSLLAALAEKPRLWIDFGTQLALPVIELLHTTDNPPLQDQCLIAMGEYVLTSPSTREWELFSSYAIPDKLVSIVKANVNLDLRSRAISNFESFSHHLMNLGANARISCQEDILRSLILGDLLETLVMDIVLRNGAKHMVAWKRAILELPMVFEKTSSSNDRDAECMNRLHQFCEQRFDQSRLEVSRFVEILKNNLVRVNPTLSS
ncbi:hypothetical protein FRC07_013341 [Ceratobasidium sp. 392]|nr:hypothetical protein FRC07_013341 [Ceratobasidium sp. 392]